MYRYLNKMRGDISRPTKTEEIEHINYSDIIEEDKSLTNGVAFDDDGAMADLQCMLANALMESGQFRSLASEEGKNEDYYYYDGQQNK